MERKCAPIVYLTKLDNIVGYLPAGYTYACTEIENYISSYMQSKKKNNVENKPQVSLVPVKKENYESYECEEDHYEETLCKITEKYIVPAEVKQEPSYITESGVAYQQDPLYLSKYDIKDIKEEVVFTDGVKKVLTEQPVEDTKCLIDIVEHKVQLDDTSNISDTSETKDNNKQSTSVLEQEDTTVSGNKYWMASYTKKQQKKFQKHSTQKKLKIFCNSKIKNNSYECFYSCKLFNSKTILNNHMTKIHMETFTVAALKKQGKKRVQKRVKYECDQCQEKFTSKYYLTVHFNSIHKRVRHECNQCIGKFTSKSSLIQHISSIHKRGRYECDQCSAKFSSNSNFTKHKKAIHERIRYECDQCLAKFSSKSNLTMHKKAIHERVKYECGQCPGKFTAKSSLIDHIRSIHTRVRYECDQCRGKFTTKSNLTVHKKTIHEGVRYECGQCPGKFTSKAMLTEHINAKHKGLRYKCDTCHGKFFLKCSLLNHVNSIHKRVRYECDQCLGKFTSKSNLAMHKKTIHERKRYECDQCPGQFTSKYYLIKHVKGVHK